MIQKAKRLIQKDQFAVWVLAIILSVLSLSTSISAQQAARAARKTDIIAECTTPGTRCSNLAEQNVIKQNQFFVDLITKTNRCLLSSAFKEGQPALSGSERVQAYDTCVKELPPLPDVTTTTTIKKGKP